MDLAFLPLTRYQDPPCISKLHFGTGRKRFLHWTRVPTLSLSLSLSHTFPLRRGWGAQHNTAPKLSFPATTGNRSHDTQHKTQSIGIRYVTYSVSSDFEVFLRFGSDQAISVATNLEPFLCFFSPEPSVPMFFAPPHVVTCNRNCIPLFFLLPLSHAPTLFASHVVIVVCMLVLLDW